MQRHTPHLDHYLSLADKKTYFTNLTGGEQFVLISELLSNDLEEELDNLTQSGINIVFYNCGLTPPAIAAFENNKRGIKYFQNRFHRMDKHFFSGWLLAGNVDKARKIFDPDVSRGYNATFGLTTADFTELYMIAIICALAGKKKSVEFILNSNYFENYNNNYLFSKDDVIALLNKNFDPETLRVEWDPKNFDAKLLIALMYFMTTFNIDGFAKWLLEVEKDYYNRPYDYIGEEYLIWPPALECITKYFGLETGILFSNYFKENLKPRNEYAIKRHYERKGIEVLIMQLSDDPTFTCQEITTNIEIIPDRPTINLSPRQIKEMVREAINDGRYYCLLHGLFQGMHTNIINFQLQKHNIPFKLTECDWMSQIYRYYLEEKRLDLVVEMANKGWLSDRLENFIHNLTTGYNPINQDDILEIATLIDDKKLSKKIIKTLKSDTDYLLKVSKQISLIMQYFLVGYKSAIRVVTPPIEAAYEHLQYLYQQRYQRHLKVSKDHKDNPKIDRECILALEDNNHDQAAARSVKSSQPLLSAAAAAPAPAGTSPSTFYNQPHMWNIVRTTRPESADDKNSVKTTDISYRK